jgi:small subunit ribosomal protein S7e
MLTTNAKIIKGGGAEPDQFEVSVSQALLELEMNSDLKSQLRELYITKAKEIETNNKKVDTSFCALCYFKFHFIKIYIDINYCMIQSFIRLFFLLFLLFHILRKLCLCFQSIIIYVPMPKLKAFQKIQTRLVRELEKKFSGKHVMFVGERKILPKPTRKTRTKNKQKRPRR